MQASTNHNPDYKALYDSIPDDKKQNYITPNPFTNGYMMNNSTVKDLNGTFSKS